jgi:hypothetical protein
MVFSHIIYFHFTVSDRSAHNTVALNSELYEQTKKNVKNRKEAGTTANQKVRRKSNSIEDHKRKSKIK